MVHQEERFSRSLPCKFSPDELRAKADELAESVANLNALEKEKKQVASDYKGRIDNVSAKVSILARHISQKQEYQHVECTATLATSEPAQAAESSQGDEQVPDGPIDAPVPSDDEAAGVEHDTAGRDHEFSDDEPAPLLDEQDTETFIDGLAEAK